MPIKIPEALPARAVLESENIFLMNQYRAEHQDIRPLRILILNLMPTKIVTETQLSRALSNTPLQIEVELLQTTSHVPKNTPQSHLIAFYKTFEEVKERRYDGFIVTGAPVEQLPFEEVDYWEELCGILDWSSRNVWSSLFICWGAQAALRHFYGIEKYPLRHKLSGIYRHRVLVPNVHLLRGFDDEFWAPHSRFTEVRERDIRKQEELLLLADSPEAGAYIAMSRDGRQVFVTGHSEYDRDTLKGEYLRDIDKGLDPSLPVNYFPGGDPSATPVVTWRSHSNLLFSNWLNYYVYQLVPYDLESL